MNVNKSTFVCDALPAFLRRLEHCIFSTFGGVGVTRR
jgi:hypothetical protein